MEDKGGEKPCLAKASNETGQLSYLPAGGPVQVMVGYQAPVERMVRVMVAVLLRASPTPGSEVRQLPKDFVNLK